MVILGLLLLAACIVAGVEIGLSNQDVIGAEAFDMTVAQATPVTFLVVGAALGFLVLLSLLMMTGGVRRATRRRTTAKHAVRRVEDDRHALLEENERLRAELVTERRQRDTLGGVAVPPGVGDTTYGDQISDAVRSNTISDTGRYEPYPDEPTAAGQSTVGAPAAEPMAQPRRDPHTGR